MALELSRSITPVLLIVARDGGVGQEYCLTDVEGRAGIVNVAGERHAGKGHIDQVQRTAGHRDVFAIELRF